MLQPLKRVRALLHNVVFDLRYGRFLGGNVPTKYSHLGAHDTVNSPYTLLPTLFAGLVRPGDVLVDVGCGRGRVINWWLDQKLDNAMVGLELDDEIAAQTRKRLARYPNVSIITGDASANLPADGTVFYLYSPFNADTMARFEASIRTRSSCLAEVRIVYFNPEHVAVFEQSDVWTITPIDLSGADATHTAVLVTARSDSES